MASLPSINALGAAAGRRTALSTYGRRGGGADGGCRRPFLALLQNSFITSSSSSSYSPSPLLASSTILSRKPKATTRTTTTTKSHRHHQQHRSLTTTPPRPAIPKRIAKRPSPNTGSGTTPSSPASKPSNSNLNGPHTKAERGRPPQNEEIKYPKIYLRTASDPSSSSTTLSPPLPLADVLAQLNRKTHILQLVVSPQPNWQLEPYPICRIVDKAAERALEKKLAKEKKESRIVTKTLELNWAIGPHDLGHKLRRLAEFLENGYKVEILLAPRKRGKKAAEEEEAEEVVRRVEETAARCRAFEVKKREGIMLGTLRLYFQGRKEGKAGKESDQKPQSQSAGGDQVQAGAQSEVIGEQGG